MFGFSQEGGRIITGTKVKVYANYEEAICCVKRAVP